MGTAFTNRIGHIDELASVVNDARCDLRSALQWHSDDARAIAAALHAFESATAVLIEYAVGTLEAASQEVK